MVLYKSSHSSPGKENLCSSCGYDLHGIDAIFCPECGAPVTRSSAKSSPPRSWAMIFAELGVNALFCASVWLMLIAIGFAADLAAGIGVWLLLCAATTVALRPVGYILAATLGFGSILGLAPMIAFHFVPGSIAIPLALAIGIPGILASLWAHLVTPVICRAFV